MIKKEDLVLANVYMPDDPTKTDSTTEEEWQDLAEDFIKHRKHTAPVLLGDFNARIGKSRDDIHHVLIGDNTEEVIDEAGNTMRHWMQVMNITALNGRNPGQIEHTFTTRTGKSVIDYALVENGQESKYKLEVKGGLLDKTGHAGLIVTCKTKRKKKRRIRRKRVINQKVSHGKHKGRLQKNDRSRGI